MEKTKEKKQDKIRENGEKKLTKDQAIEILEREILEDQVKLIKKQGALEVLKQIDQIEEYAERQDYW